MWILSIQVETRPRFYVATERAPTASSERVSRRMAAQRVEDTAPELALRRRLHAMGLRYRLHRSVLAGVRRRHDIVFPSSKVVVEVLGCWWHGCPLHYHPPESNREWWDAKISRNRERDADTRARLHDAGWRLVCVWEHEDVAEAADRVASVVREAAAESV